LTQNISIMKKFFYLLIFIFPVMAHSQATPGKALKKWKAGVFVGLFQPYIVLDNKKKVDKIDERGGFTFGSLLEANLNKRFSLTAKAGISFDGTTIQMGGGCVFFDYEVMPVSLDMSLDIIYHPPFDPMIYIFAGAGYKNPFDTEYQKDIKSSMGIDLGIGFNKFLKRFAISPELRYFWGISNIRPVLTEDALYYHSIALVINIKG